MAERTIPQRELRNNVGAVLRAAEAGDTFTVTVRGRPVARVMPLQEPGYPRKDVPWGKLNEIIELTPVDEGFLDDVMAVRRGLAREDDPWGGR